LSLIGLYVIGISYNLYLVSIQGHPSYSGFAANLFWSGYNLFMISILIAAAFWNPDYSQNEGA
jgi:hypothetical protein